MFKYYTNIILHLMVQKINGPAQIRDCNYLQLFRQYS